jgi:hypothetical protein
MSGLGKGWEPVQQQSCISPGKKDRKLLIKVPDDLAPLFIECVVWFLGGYLPFEALPSPAHVLSLWHDHQVTGWG